MSMLVISNRRFSLWMVAAYVFGVLVGGAVCLYEYEFRHRQSPIEQAIIQDAVGLFQAKDCLVHKGELETWESYVDALVWKVGKGHYLIVSTPNANQMATDGHRERFVAETLPKSFVESAYQKTTCPKMWRHLVTK